jgi:cytosine/adenosine deaminase-related metal-dependent hydrolase
MRGLLEHPDFFGWIRTLTRARAEVLDDARCSTPRGSACSRGWRGRDHLRRHDGQRRTAAGAGRLRRARHRLPGGVRAGRVAARRAMDGLRARVAALRARATPLVQVGVSPHAVYSVHEELLLDACAWALGEGLPLAMHVSESAAEVEFLREGEGPFADFLRGRGIPVARRAHSPVHLLAELGIAATARPLLIHGVQFDASDVALAAHYDCPVAHCPASNAKLGHGVAPLRALLDAGVRVGLGTDSVASNNRLDVLDEARLAALQQRAVLARGDALGADEALALATIGGARALGLEATIGSLEPGKAADLAAWRLDDGDARAITAGDLASTLVFALAGRRADHVTVQGRTLVRGGGVLHPDAAAVAARVRRRRTRCAPGPPPARDRRRGRERCALEVRTGDGLSFGLLPPEAPPACPTPRPGARPSSGATAS